MAMIDINWDPDKGELRKFGEISLAMLLVIGLVLYWLGRVRAETALYVAAAGLVIFLLSRTTIRGTKPIYWAAYGVTYPVGWVLSHLILGVVYYLIVTPIGLIFRLLGRDALRRTYDPEAPSYWVDHEPAGHVERYFRQF